MVFYHSVTRELDSHDAASQGEKGDPMIPPSPPCNPGPPFTSDGGPAYLLEQLQYALLHLVRLRQGGNAGLAQDLVLGQVSHRLRNVGGLNAVLRGSQILRLVGHDVACSLQPVGACAD